MKTNKCVIGFLILTAVFVQSCKKGGMWGIKGQGENITEVRNVSDFDKIQLSTDADIEYVQDSIYKLEVNAQKNILAVLETKVVANELIIDFKRNVWEHHKIGIIIHSPNMHKINLSGSGVMTIKNKINSPSLDVTISGSGNLSINSMTVQSFSSDRKSVV